MRLKSFKYGLLLLFCFIIGEQQLYAAADVDLDRIEVQGTARDGYRVEEVYSTGPWGTMSIQNTPISIMVMPHEMIQNIGASSPDYLLRLNPLINVATPMARAGSVPVTIRGFRYSSAVYEDGFRTGTETFTGWGIFLEDVERVEVITGMAGFQYGVEASGNVGGLVNYVSKRPTQYRLNSVTVGNYGWNQWYGHGDFGGKIDKNGKLSYRVNVLGQHGSTNVEHQKTTRFMASGALDWRITNKILVQGRTAYGSHKVKGLPAFWNITGREMPSRVPDPEKLWTQKWTYNKVDAAKASINGSWRINDIFSLRAAYSFKHGKREWHALNNQNFSGDDYRQSTRIQAPNKSFDHGFNIYGDAKFSVADIEQKITFGWSGNYGELRQHSDNQAIRTLDGFNLSGPVYKDEPDYSIGKGPWVTNRREKSNNIVICDRVGWRMLELMAGVNIANTEKQTYNTDGSKKDKGHFNKTALTPQIAFLVKPVKEVTAYFNYMEGLEQGTIVSNNGSITYTNDGEALKPLRSRQYEMGVKSTVYGMFLTLAGYLIDKPNDYERDNGNGTFTLLQDGREVHKGIEFTVSGKLFNMLTLYGGFTVMDIDLRKTSTTGLWGKRPTDTAESMAKLYMELDIPYLTGLTFTGGCYFTGSYYADARNADRLPAVVTGDIGLRYVPPYFGRDMLTLRLNISNISNNKYWLNHNYTGEPRNIMFSVQAKI